MFYSPISMNLSNLWETFEQEMGSDNEWKLFQFLIKRQHFPKNLIQKFPFYLIIDWILSQHLSNWTNIFQKSIHTIGLHFLYLSCRALWIDLNKHLSEQFWLLFFFFIHVPPQIFSFKSCQLGPIPRKISQSFAIETISIAKHLLFVRYWKRYIPTKDLYIGSNSFGNTKRKIDRNTQILFNWEKQSVCRR